MFNNIYEDIIKMSLKNVYENLSTIAKIKLNDKLYHDETNVFIEDSYIPSIKRKYRGSGRADTVKFIKYIFTQAHFQLELLNKRTDPESIHLHMNLLNGFKSTIAGLTNLQTTYESDISITYEIQKNINYINKFFT